MDALIDALQAILDGDPRPLPPARGDAQHDRLRALLARLVPSAPPVVAAPVGPLLRALAASGPARVSGRGLLWRAAISPALPERAMVDPGRLEALIDDLLTCAIFVARGPSVVGLAAGPLEVEGRACLRVSIEGPGLVLGLPGALLVEARAMGAQLHPPTAVDPAAHLDLRIEAAAAVGAPASRRSAAARAGRVHGLRVLAVDDNEVNRFILSALLEELGCEAVVLDGGRAALDHLDENEVDAVILDLYMPGIDGFALARALRRREAESGARRVAILALTGDDGPATAEACLAAGIDARLVKPADPEAVVAALLACAPRGSSAESVEAPPSRPIERRRPVEPELDLKQVNMMREVMGPTAFAELVGTFLMHTDEQLDALEASLRAADWSQALRLAHGVKSGTAQMGADAVSRQARTLEDRIRVSDVIDVDDAILGLRRALNKARAALTG